MEEGQLGFVLESESVCFEAALLKHAETDRASVSHTDLNTNQMHALSVAIVSGKLMLENEESLFGTNIQLLHICNFQSCATLMQHSASSACNKCTCIYKEFYTLVKPCKHVIHNCTVHFYFNLSLFHSIQSVFIVYAVF